jgi:hypothetical protein
MDRFSDDFTMRPPGNVAPQTAVTKTALGGMRSGKGSNPPGTWSIFIRGIDLTVVDVRLLVFLTDICTRECYQSS